MNPVHVFTGILLSAAASAQTAGVADSPLMGIPSGISVDPMTKGPTGLALDATAVLAKDFGFATSAPAFFTTLPTKPDFTPGVMFPGLVPRPDIDAMSIGLDWIWATAGGFVVIPPAPNWSGLTFSISRTTAGAAGSRIALEAARPDGAAGDLFSYLFPCPALPVELHHKVHLVQDSSEIAIWDGIQRGNLDAHDIFMALYDLDSALASVLPPMPYFYFSVTKTSLANVPAAWWGATTASGASILRMRWTGTAWTAPSVWIRYDQLGLLVDAELDALAVDEARGFMLFSTHGNAADEIMFANLNADAISTAVYRYPATLQTPETPVSVRLGLAAADDIDAICALDPGDVASVMRGAFVARPLTALLPFQRFVSGSTFRRQLSATGRAQVESWLTGFPLNQPQPGFAAFFVQGVTPLTAPIQLLQTPRNPGGPHGGAPTRAQILLPTLSGLVGVDLDFTWAAFNPSFTLVDLTIPARLRV
jgi:hypothetical protein